ncbi:MAG: PAS domain-containing protein [Prosthecobacter sp.]
MVARTMNREQLDSLILSSLPVALFTKDLDSRFTFVNPKLCELLNLPLDTAVGQTDQELLSPMLAAQYEQEDRQIMATGKPSAYFELLTQPSGKQIPVRVTKTLLFGTNGEPIGILGILDELHSTSIDAPEEKRLQEMKRTLAVLDAKISHSAPSTVPASRLFISYKHSSPEHVEWVEQLYRDLVEVHGIECLLDKYDLAFGDSISAYMDRIATEATHVLLVLDSATTKAIRDRIGGVAFESELASALRNERRLRLIPVLREGSDLPACVRDCLYVDFRLNELYRDALLRLANSIKGIHGKPTPGSRNGG